MNGSDIVDPLFERIVGRVLAEDLVDMTTGNVLVAAGQMVTEEHASAIEESGADQAKIRSALSCEADTGICANCYGRDLARGTEVNIGEAVGVIAAQSIGDFRDPAATRPRNRYPMSAGIRVGCSATCCASNSHLISRPVAGLARAHPGPAEVAPDSRRTLRPTSTRRS